ncbi:MAG: chitobiase/beta-hexosaminidase C-terminal domain-containing protein [Candidatus Cloacimonetes bacterium]|nr:chitobiase/beta-hexosaminidase C-terminal domain-containing protein [Candidatus Cloacimonadota bacterium]
MKKTLLFILILFTCICLFPQERALGHLIVWHHEHIRGEMRAEFMSRYAAQNMAEEQVLSPELNIVLYTFNHRAFDEDEMLEMVRRDSSVYLAQFNPYMTLRNEEHLPNDPGFNNQWHLKNTGQSGGAVGVDTGATFGWGAALTEENRNQREIVLAVIDGIHTSTLAHQDLRFWKNNTGWCHNVVGGNMHGLSCPNTPVCDYHGWNGNTNQPLSANHTNNETHGTVVSGSTAQITNNNSQGAGIGGLFENVKLMPIHIGMAGQLNSEAINSFNYILRVRKLYNDTNGQYGAYIVAHNNSWGIDAAWPSQYPVWAALYDTLGAEGMLATIAVDNNSGRNIDTFGDMPGTVTSPYATKVTRINRSGNRTGAFGPTMVQLAIPGDAIFTTLVNNNHGNSGNTGGTSYAAPQLMGMIGLMYSTASEALLSAYDDNPDELALIFRNLILDNVTPMTNLSGQVSTGGRLNALPPIEGVLQMNSQYIIEPDDRIPFTEFTFEGDTLNPSLGEGIISSIGGISTTFAQGFLENAQTGRALNTTTYPAQGTGNETAGINIQVSTEGLLNIHVSWNNRNSNTGANRMRLQYTIDGTNWQNFHADATNATNKRVFPVNNVGDVEFDNGLYAVAEGESWYYRTADFSEIEAINNNPDFAVRFVIAFPTGSTQYGGSGATSNYAPGGTIRFDNVTFYFTDTADVEFVSPPIATPAGGTYLTPISVTLVTETVGASIYYTTDGSSPSAENGILYISPISLTTTTILRFRGEKDGMLPSGTITETYNIPLQISSLSQLRLQTPGTGDLFHLNSEVIVSMTQPNFRNQIYVQDGNGGLLIDDNANIISPTYNIGDGVTGLTGEINLFNGMLQFVPFMNSGQVTSTNNALIPVEVNFEDLNNALNDYQARLVKVYGVLFSTTGNFANFTDYPVYDDTANYTFRTNFDGTDYVGNPIPEVPVNITGIISTRNTGSHIAARFASEIEIMEIDVETPVINPPGGFNIDPITVSITCETENVMIYYTIDGSQPDEESLLYEAPFEISQTTTIRAIAIDLFNYHSLIKTENYTFPIDVENLTILKSMDADNTTVYRITNEVLVSYTQPFRNQIYVQDEVAGILIDNLPQVLMTEYEIGDGITGLLGRLNVFQNMIQFLPEINDLPPSSTGNAIEPIILTLEELSESGEYYQSKLVSIKNVRFSTSGEFLTSRNYELSDITGSYNFRTQFHSADYIGDTIPNVYLHLTGLISANNDGYYITARSWDDMELLEIEPLFPPKNLNAVVSIDTVILTWEAPERQNDISSIHNYFSNLNRTNNEITQLPTFLGYKVYRDDFLLTQETITTLSYTDEGLDRDEKYVYSVTSIYEEGESEPVSLDVIVPKLNPIKELSADYKDGIVNLLWQAPEPEQYAVLRGYDVYRDDFKLNDEPIEDEFYTDNLISLFEIIDITYQVIAVYDLGESEPLILNLYVLELDPIADIYVNQLGRNIPNPFNPETTISFTMEDSGNVTIEIFNIRGQRIKMLVNDFKERGSHQILWNGTDDFGNAVGSGMYLYRMITDDFSDVKRMLLLK